MSDWKTAYRSFYYDTAEAPDDIQLDADRTALLVIDIQNTYLEVADDRHEAERWAPFRERMNNTVIPNTAKLIADCRARGVEVIFARIACLTRDGRDRSLSQKKPGFNYLLLPKDRQLPVVAERPCRQPVGARVDARGRRYRRAQNYR